MVVVVAVVAVVAVAAVAGAVWYVCNVPIGILQNWS